MARAFRLLAFALITAVPTSAAAQEPPAGFLVWRGEETEWLDAAGAILGTREGILVSDGERVFRLESVVREVTLPSCAELDSTGTPRSREAGEVTHLRSLELVDLLDGTRTVLVDGTAVTVGSLGGIVSLDQSLTVTNSLGTLLFVRYGFFQYSCGAHGSGETGSIIVEVPTGTLPHRELSAGGRSRALARMRERWAGADPDQSAEDAWNPSEEDLRLVELLPVWREDRGRLLGRARWADGSERWQNPDSFVWDLGPSASIDVAPPRWMRDVASEFPTAVLSRLTDEGIGISALDARGAAAARTVFGAP